MVEKRKAKCGEIDRQIKKDGVMHFSAFLGVSTEPDLTKCIQTRLGCKETSNWIGPGRVVGSPEGGEERGQPRRHVRGGFLFETQHTASGGPHPHGGEGGGRPTIPLGEGH